MKLIDALLKVDKSERNSVSWLYSEYLSNSLGLVHRCFNFDDDKFNNHFKGYYVYRHLCTDTFVGLIALYLDDELVGYSYQPARKSAITYKFVSKEMCDKLISLIRSCEQIDYNEYDLPIDPEEEIDDYHKVIFSGQLQKPVGTEGTYKGTPVILVRPWSDKKDIIDHYIFVKVKDTGEELKIDVSQFHYPLNVNVK
jgi:hypothetical protein